MALGCDTVAHSTCIDNNGKTIAVLPSTIDNIYPSENKEIAEKIVKNGGLLVSEYHKIQFLNMKQLVDLLKEIGCKQCSQKQ